MEYGLAGQVKKRLVSKLNWDSTGQQTTRRLV